MLCCFVKCFIKWIKLYVWFGVSKYFFFVVVVVVVLYNLFKKDAKHPAVLKLSEPFEKASRSSSGPLRLGSGTEVASFCRAALKDDVVFKQLDHQVTYGKMIYRYNLETSIIR